MVSSQVSFVWIRNREMCRENISFFLAQVNIKHTPSALRETGLGGSTQTDTEGGR